MCMAGRFVYGVMAASAGTAVFWSTLGPRLFPQACLQLRTQLPSA